MKIKLQEQIENVYVVYFEDNYDLAMTFVRIQEFYESPEFRGKFFTLEEYMDYWSKNFGHGSFDYPARWAGFNIPGSVLEGWIDVFGYSTINGELSKNNTSMRDKELILLRKIMGRVKRTTNLLSNIYVIGCNRNNPKKESIISHETAHAMFTLFPEYKKTMERLIKTARKKDVSAAKQKILDMGYGENVVVDEIQAYWATSDLDIPLSEDTHPSDPLGGRENFKQAYRFFLKKKKT